MKWAVEYLDPSGTKHESGFEADTLDMARSMVLAILRAMAESSDGDGFSDEIKVMLASRNGPEHRGWSYEAQYLAKRMHDGALFVTPSTTYAFAYFEPVGLALRIDETPIGHYRAAVETSENIELWSHYSPTLAEAQAAACAEIQRYIDEAAEIVRVCRSEVAQGRAA